MIGRCLLDDYQVFILDAQIVEKGYFWIETSLRLFPPILNQCLISFEPGL